MQALALAYVLDDAVLCLTVSVGVSVAAPETTPSMLSGEADSAMVAARRAGGGRFTWYLHGEPAGPRLPQHGVTRLPASATPVSRPTEDKPGV